MGFISNNDFIFIVFTVVLVFSSVHSSNWPLVAVLSQEHWPSQSQSYIAASYVKFLESAGARVIPVLINQNDEYYKRIFNHTSGLLIPGGGQDLHNSGYAKAGKLLWQLALNSSLSGKPGDQYPIWGTCLGFELLTQLYSKDTLCNCSALDLSSSLTPVGDWKKSRLFQNADAQIIKALQSEENTYNFHKICLNLTSFENSGLKDHFTLLSTTKDKNNLVYVSTIESKKGNPIYGTQWHPEKNQFEFAYNKAHENIPHSANAVLIGQYMANFFVNECRKTERNKIDLLTLTKELIYNYQPLYTGTKVNYTFEQIYVFNSTKSNQRFVALNYCIFVVILALNLII